MSDPFTKTLYEEHHDARRAPGFSILKEERGKLFAALMGSGKRVLDIGCRDGALTRHFAEGNSVVGVDVDEVALARARESLGIEARTLDAHGDWHELAGEKFDVVVAGEVLEHLFYPERVLKHIAVHLTQDGMFVGSVPNAFSLKNKLRYLVGKKKNTPLEDPTHINHFSVRELDTLLHTYFMEAQVIGLGRHAFLARHFPDLFAFDLAFEARKPIPVQK